MRRNSILSPAVRQLTRTPPLGRTLAGPPATRTVRGDPFYNNGDEDNGARENLPPISQSTFCRGDALVVLIIP